MAKSKEGKQVLQQWILYRNATPGLQERYSAFKFGDVNVIRELADELSELIRTRAGKTKKHILYTTHRPVELVKSKKSSLMLTELIAKKLALPIAIGNYSHRYQEKNFYDNAKDRKKISEQFSIDIKNISVLRKMNASVIFIDDSIVTGETLEHSLPELQKISDNIIFAGLLKIDPNKYSEPVINQCIYTKYGISILREIISHEEYFFTNQMLRTIKGLSEKSRGELFRGLLKEKKAIHRDAERVYFK